MLYKYPISGFGINKILGIVRNLSSKVPTSPGKVLEKEQNQKVHVDKQTLALLERLSLVRCDTAEGVKVLEDSIAFANKILHINTDNIQPLYSVLEKENLFLRRDLVTQGNCQKDILRNASVKEDDYFVAPPGNIPLHEIEKERVESGISSKHENSDTKSIEVTTTPSLFAINEVEYKDKTADANIVAQFPWGKQTVETISMISKGMVSQNSSQMKCSMSLENAMFILLLDGLINKRASEYLKLHRSMTPYKISFALNSKDVTKRNNLHGLASLMHQRLKSKDISSCLPNFTLSLEQQITESLQLGVTYTALLCDETLTNGIFYLLNSSTLLKEVVHVADFDSYATLLCGK